jgi:hypothetical protein
MTLKEESVIEMIAYKRKKNFGCDFPWFRFTIQKMSYHWVSIQRDVTGEKSGKRTADKN